jgi:hypothetical protein
MLKLGLVSLPISKPLYLSKERGHVPSSGRCDGHHKIDDWTDIHTPAACVALPIRTFADWLKLRTRRGVQPAVDVKSLHAKIGELMLENDFLEGALGKGGLLSAKR